MPRNSRDLSHLKSARVKVGQGFPRNSEGSTGDLTLRMTRTGIKLFAKFQGKWYMVGQGNLNRLGSDGINEDQIIGTNNKKISTVDKEGIVKLRERALLDMKPWKIRNTKYDSAWGDTAATDKGLVFHNEQEQMKFIMGNNGTVLFEDSSSASMPQFIIRNKQNDAGGPWLTLEHDDANPAIAQDFGRINFQSDNDAGDPFVYSAVVGQASDITDGSEEGKLLLRAASGSGNVQIAIVGDGTGSGYVQISNDCAVGGKLFLDQVNGDTYLHHSSGDVLDYYVGGDLMMRQTEIATVGNFTQIFGGEISTAVDNASTDALNYVLELTQTLNDTSNVGTPKYKGIKFVLTNTDITGWDEIYMMHLAGAGTTWINNAGSIAIPAAQKVFLDGGTDAANGHTYISETSDDVLDVYVGNKRMIRLDESNDKITHAAANYVAAIANGTEFSATNSAYAGMILGYTRLKGDGTNISTFEIEDSMTVEDSTHQITFKTPPSEKVEIEATFCINVGTTDTRIDVGLSDSSTYNSVGVGFEYDNTGLLFSDDEMDDGVCTVKWVLEASELAAIGSSNTFYIGFSTHGVTKSAWLQYGTRSSHSVTDHPFVIKAIALPASIYDGT